jgi:polysaccharide biosynthesis transport protein
MHDRDHAFSVQDRLVRDAIPLVSEFIDFPRLGNLIRAKFWMIVAIACVVFLAAVAYVLRAPKVYGSRAVLQVSQEPQKIVNKIEDVSEDKPDSADYLNTVVEGFTSRKLMLRVVRSLGLERDPNFVPPKKDGSPYNDIELVDLMSAKLKVSLRRNTRLIDVNTFDEDPEMARKLAATFVDGFLHETYEQRRSAARVAHQFLREESRQLKAQLEEAERKLQAYKESNKAVSLEERQDIIVEQLREINKKATEAKSTRLRLEADLEQIKRIDPSDTQQLLQIESVAQLPQVALIRERLLKAKNDLAAIAKRNLPMHPRFLTAQTRIVDLNASLKETLSKAGNMVAKQYDAAVQTEAKLQKSLKEQEQKALELSRIAIPYNVLLRDIESDRALYESVTLRLKETYITEAIDSAPFRVIEEPMAATSPSKPRKKFILALALVLGVVMGIGTVIGLDLIDSSLRTVDEAESYLGLPALASVPERRDTTLLGHLKTAQRHPILLFDAPASAAAEAFRSLRTSISLLGKASEFRNFLFTSALPTLLGHLKTAQRHPVLLFDAPASAEAEAFRSLRTSISLLGKASEFRNFLFTSALPTLLGHLKTAQRHPVLLFDAPASAEAEAFRSLRTSISLLGKASELRSFLFTSALPSEGKTFVALNFAASFAEQGLETVIIDADLREPRLAQALLTEAENPGLTDLLSGQIGVNEAVKATRHENLRVLPAGRRVPNPAKLLSNREFDRVVESLLQEFDRVVIDTPPVNAVSDSLLLAASAHATCLVVRAGKTPKKAIRRSIQQLHVAEARLAGFVFNRLPIHGRSAGYYYYYYGERYATAGDSLGWKRTADSQIAKR